MRKIRTAVLAILFTAALVVSQAGPANAAPAAKVKGVGSVVDEGGVAYDFSFNGAEANKGGYTILGPANPKPPSASGKADCFNAIGDYAVVAGTAAYRNGSILGGGQFLLIIAFDSPDSNEDDAIFITTTLGLECPTTLAEIQAIDGYDLDQITGGYITVTP